MKPPRYFAQEYVREHWHICDRQDGNRPVYDNGGNNILTFQDHDAVMECVNNLNESATWNEQAEEYP